MTDTTRNVITIGPSTLCCPCHGRPLWRTYQPDYTGSYRYRDACAVDGADLGYDAAVTRAMYEHVQARKRIEAAA